MSSDQLDELERRILRLERQRPLEAAQSVRPSPSPPPDDGVDVDAVSLQAFLQGALAAGAMRSAVPAAVGNEGVAPAFLSIFGCEPSPQRGDGGQTAVRAFWWGFHVQLSHQDLTTVLASADTVNDLVVAVGGNIPSPAAPWIKLIGPFVSATHDALRALDRGRGIYISMSWATPGVFIPTTVA